LCRLPRILTDQTATVGVASGQRVGRHAPHCI
jgi:hypothetical protein